MSLVVYGSTVASPPEKGEKITKQKATTSVVEGVSYESWENLCKSCGKFGFSHDSSGKGRFPLTSKCDKIIQNPEIDCYRAGGQPKLVYYSFLLFVGGGVKYVLP